MTIPADQYDDLPRLQVRRTVGQQGSTLSLRLSDDVSRTADLYELLRSGLFIEVVDIRVVGQNETPQATLAIRAPTEFQLDRLERLLAPRPVQKVLAEPVVQLTTASDMPIDELSIEELDSLLHTLRQQELALANIVTRLRRDKSRAHERGYHFRENDQHELWIVLVEELDTVMAQREATRVSISQVRDRQKTLRYLLDHEDRTNFENAFVRLARERLDKATYKALLDEARAAAKQSTSQ